MEAGQAGTTQVLDPSTVEPAPTEAPAVTPPAATAPAEVDDHLAQIAWNEPANERKFDLKNIDLRDIPKNMILGGIALLFGVAGLFLPWMTSVFGSAGAFDAALPWKFTGGDLSTGVTGIIGHGYLYVLLFGVGAAALAGRLPNRKVSTMATGGAITLLTAVNYLEFSGSTGDAAGAGLGISVSFGLYAMLLAGLTLLVSGLVTE